MQSRSKSIGVSSVKTVTADRKKELLMEARNTRISWVQSSLFPFIEATNIFSVANTRSTGTGDDNDNGNNNNNSNNNDNSNDNEKDTKRNMKTNKNTKEALLNPVKNICQDVKLPSVIPIIELLLNGTPNKDLEEITSTWNTKLAMKNGTCNDNDANESDSDEYDNGNEYNNEYNNDNGNDYDNGGNSSSSSDALMESLMSKTDDPAFLFYYKEVLDKLCLPECADIVQGMRHFVRTFGEKSAQLQTKIQSSKDKKKNIKKKKKKNTNTNKSGSGRGSSDDEDNSANTHLKTLAKALQNYLTKLYDTLSNHSAWRANGISSDTKMMLETFIYAKCYLYIQPLLSMVTIESHDDDDTDDDTNDDTNNDANDNDIGDDNNDVVDNDLQVDQDEAAMKKRLNFLQFLEPKHLDMHSIIDDNDEDDDDNDKNENQDKSDTIASAVTGTAAGTATATSTGSDEVSSWKTKLDLSKPILNIQCLDTMYSPAQMLRCILEIYRGVNEALSACLKIRNDSSTTSGAPNVSADDVLPSLILTVVHGTPDRIISVLTFLEMFATEEQIRGEAGYAYTNLYSAVQFIKELDLQIDANEKVGGKNDEGGDDAKRSGKPTLSMSPEALQEKMKIYRQQLATGSTLMTARDNDSNDDSENEEKIDSESEQLEGNAVASIAPFQKIEIPAREIKAARLRGDNIEDWATQWFEQNELSTLQSHIAPGESTRQEDIAKPSSLPSLEGFSHSYTFLGTDPNDVKVSDIPKLLEEYKMLVRTTETLIMERNSSIHLNQQTKMKLKRKNLESSLEDVMKASSVSTEKRND